MVVVEELRYLILASQREGARRMAEALEPLGVTTSQAEVLRVLLDREPLSLAEVGARLICETGSPSRLVARLVAEGLVSQTPSAQDLRKVVLGLTPRGREVALAIEQVEAGFYGSLEGLLAGAPVEAVRTLLWALIEGRPSAQALRLRKEESHGPR